MRRKKKDIYVPGQLKTGAVESLYDFSEGTIKVFLQIGFVKDVIDHKDKVNTRCVNAGPEVLLKEQKDVAEYLLKNVGISLTKKLMTDLHEKFVAPARFTMYRTSPFSEVTVLIRKGKFKIIPNIVQEDDKNYVYCPPEKVEEEIAKLIDLYHKYRERKCSPFLLSAWLHHRFIQIHPFQDGNGRVCRAISSLILIENTLPPVIIYKKNRLDYYAALRHANNNNGDLGPLIKCMIQNYEEAFKICNEIISKQ